MQKVAPGIARVAARRAPVSHVDGSRGRAQEPSSTRWCGAGRANRGGPAPPHLAARPDSPAPLARLHFVPAQTRAQSLHQTVRDPPLPEAVAAPALMAGQRTAGDPRLAPAQAACALRVGATESAAAPGRRRSAGLVRWTWSALPTGQPIIYRGGEVRSPPPSSAIASRIEESAWMFFMR